MFLVKIFVLAILIIKNVQGATRVDPLVETKVGLIQGLRASDGDYSMFLGIPYARVDKDNPFGVSVPIPKFEDKFEAFDDSATCPQWSDITGTIIGSIDCLRLNIYVPNTASSQNRLPVMLYIYGGNFERGMGWKNFYGPKFLIKQDVIVVIMSYRIGPYGFMCLRTPEVPGNQALKDQLAAMRWVKENIESFGGDVNRITLFGQSAGGRAVELHLMSPQEKLFNNVILESGTSLVRETVLEPDTRVPFKLAEHLGFKTNETSEAISFLAKAPIDLVIAATTELDLLSYLRPCVEKPIDNVEPFITDHAFNSKLPKVNGLPILIGYNNNEQVARYADKDPSYFDGLNVIYDRLKREFDFCEDELNEMEELVRHFYLGDKAINQDVMWELIDFDSDFTYAHTTERSIDMYLENGAENVFYYVFSYVGGRNYYKERRNVTVGGASHADETGYLFDMNIFYQDDPKPEDQRIVDRMTTLWANFAKYSNPTPETSELLPVKWEPITEDLRNYLEIDLDMKLKKRPFSDRMAFWSLFYKINWKKQKGFRDY